VLEELVGKILLKQ